MPTLKEIRAKRRADERATKAQIASFTLELDSFLSRNIDRILSEIDFNPSAAGEAAAALGGLQTSLNQLGLNEVFEQLATVYGDKLLVISEAFASNSGKRIGFTEIDAGVAETLIRYDLEAFAARTRASVDELRAGVFRNVLLGDSNYNVILDDVTDGLKRSLDTELNTAISGFQRTVTMQKAKDVGVELFLYVGGLIDTSRPFCIERDGKVFSQAEIDTWDNGQGLSASVYLGGYNCRHDLVPVSQELAEELGYNG